VPKDESQDLEDRKFVIEVREAEAVTRIAGSISLTWQATVQRQPSFIADSCPTGHRNFPGILEVVQYSVHGWKIKRLSRQVAVCRTALAVVPRGFYSSGIGSSRPAIHPQTTKDPPCQVLNHI
jgi:hypothetical protein